MPDTIDLKIPGGNIEGWRASLTKAQDAYWSARRAGKTENEAIAKVVDELLSERQ